MSFKRRQIVDEFSVDKGLYSLTPGDKAIFQAAQKADDPNIITDYYLRNPNSGTWWLPGSKSQRWATGYNKIQQYWLKLKRPEEFMLMNKKYVASFEHERIAEFPGEPAFFNNHGLLFLPYAKELHNDRHTIRTVIGGFGSGKTLSQVVSLLVHGLTLMQFRAFFLAPLRIQAIEAHQLIMNLISGTEFEKRFFLAAPTHPIPTIYFGHDGVGISRIECYPVAGAETKLRTLTGDCAILDQAEHDQIDLKELIRSVGTRFRGRVSKNGRERLGTLTLLANSGDKQELWDIYDSAEDDPANYFSMSPSTYDNIWLTDKDIQRFELQVGQSEEERKMFMLGHRPLGNGQHFSRAVLEAMRDKHLDDEMQRGLDLQEKTGDDHGYVKMEGKNVGCFEWMLPYKEDHRYLVMSDPGTQNPPERDSPVIMVWDITDFPGKTGAPRPATLAAFVWVYGRGKITTWASRYAEIVQRYKAIGSCGFDATGFQAGYDQWMQIINGLFAEKVNLGGNSKALCLNSAKILTSREMFKMPGAVTHVYQQLARYEYPPEPQRMRQDIVMTFIMSAWWLQRLFYYNDEEIDFRGYDFDPKDRHWQPLEDRFGGHTRW